MSNLSVNLSAKQIEREYINAATIRFLANGSVIKVIPAGVHGVRNKVEELDNDFDNQPSQAIQHNAFYGEVIRDLN